MQKFLFPRLHIGDYVIMRAMIGGRRCVLAVMPALCVLAVVPARAGVVVHPGVPFTVAQLVAAIMTRGGPAEGGLDIDVSSPSPERLVLVTPAGQWEIEIGAASGETAARVVALHVIELGVGAAIASAAVAAASPAEAAPTPAPEVRASVALHVRHRYRVAALGTGSRGSRAGDFALVGGAIELSRAGRWIAGGGIAVQHALTIDRKPGAPVAADLVRGRAIGGVALGPAELVAGGFAGRILMDAGAGGISRWNTGLVAEARVAVPVSAAWAVVVAVGAELFRERIEVVFGDEGIGATPRASLGGGIGLAWTEESPR